MHAHGHKCHRCGTRNAALLYTTYRYMTNAPLSLVYDYVARTPVTHVSLVKDGERGDITVPIARVWARCEALLRSMLNMACFPSTTIKSSLSPFRRQTRQINWPPTSHARTAEISRIWPLKFRRSRTKSHSVLMKRTKYEKCLRTQSTKGSSTH